MKRKLTFNIPNSDSSRLNEEQTDETSGWSMPEIITHWVRHKRLIFSVTIAVMIVTAAVMFFLPDIYTSSCSILPSGNSDSKISRLSALAGLTGLGNTDDNSSELFPVILNSETIRDAVLNKEYSISKDNKTIPITLSEYFDNDKPHSLQKKLQNITTITFNKKTGVIEITAETEYPELSQGIVEQYLGQLEQYNLHERRSRAKENAEYLAGQVDKVRTELDAAEDILEAYQENNSDWAMTSDPQTLKDLGRLKRVVSIKSQTYLYLMQEYVSASLDAQKDVPVVRVLDRPELTTALTGPGRLRTTALMGIIAFFIMILLITSQTVLKQEVKPESLNYFRQELADAFPRINRLAGRINMRNGLKAEEVELNK